MNADLHEFLARSAGTVAMRPALVVLIASPSKPPSPGHHPGGSLLDADAPAAYTT